MATRICGELGEKQKRGTEQAMRIAGLKILGPQRAYPNRIRHGNDA